MKTLALTGLMLASLAGCTAASGPNYSVSSVTLPGHDHAYRVSCGGVFGGSGTCRKVAARVCGDREVEPLESTGSYRADGSQSDPDKLTFDCAEAAATTAPVTTP
ncbi:hypothetical protein [Burkholderia alba]|uniref:hypothetical protein n=1 Tax=Burkholderia alba TaxID=2683677 RepID=UPI002B05E6FB|nr:hypothetical protein [Burkholderia alba]